MPPLTEPDEPTDEEGFEVYGGGDGVEIWRVLGACCSRGWWKPDVCKDVDNADVRLVGLKCLGAAAGIGAKVEIRSEPTPPNVGEVVRELGLILRRLACGSCPSRSISAFFKCCRSTIQSRSSSDRSLFSVSSNFDICSFVKSSIHFAVVSRTTLECSVAMDAKCVNMGCEEVNGGGGRNGPSPGRKS